MRLLHKAPKFTLVVVGVVTVPDMISARSRLHVNEMAVPATGEGMCLCPCPGTEEEEEEECPVTKIDDGAEDTTFGWSVSADSNTMIVGSIQDDVGSAFVYQLDKSGEWAQQIKLFPDKRDVSATGSLLFGYSTAVSGDTALVGTYGSEKVEVFVRTDGTWELEIIFSGTHKTFGKSLDIDGNTAIVGEVGVNGSQGKVHVYTSSSYLWGPQELQPDDGQDGDKFGDSVAIHGNTIIVAAPGIGIAYVFVNNEGVWKEQQKLEPEDERSWSQSSVAIHEDVAVVGAPKAHHGGAVYVYVFVGGEDGWLETSTFTAQDVGPGIKNFGMSIVLNDGALVVGAARYDEGSDTYSNRAYVFKVESEGQLAFAGELDAGEGNTFVIKSNVAILGTTALVGAPYDRDEYGNDVGAVYAFDNCV